MRAETNAGPYYGNGAPTYGNAGGSVDVATDRILVLDDATKQTHLAVNRIGEMTQNVRAIADGIFGARPINAVGGGASIAPKASARADGLRTATSDLHYSLNQLDEELHRFRDI